MNEGKKKTLNKKVSFKERNGGFFSVVFFFFQQNNKGIKML